MVWPRSCSICAIACSSSRRNGTPASTSASPSISAWRWPPAVATEPPSRNLWGGAIGIAKVLADTAARRTIAASETAYELLSDNFLFRPRGSYFLPETGNMRTFVLVGRI